MARRPNEDRDLRLVEELLFAPRGLKLERFSQSETMAGRTPDFRVFQSGTIIAYCEVKSPRDDLLVDQLAAALPGQLVGQPRPDPTFNRVARHIEKAATQFDAVNSARSVPNFLVLVNHAEASHWGDLWETLTGTFLEKGGKQFVTIPHIARKIAQAQQRIDLFVWVDARDRRVQAHLFNRGCPNYVAQTCSLLGIDEATIKN